MISVSETCSIESEKHEISVSKEETSSKEELSKDSLEHSKVNGSKTDTETLLVESAVS